MRNHNICFYADWKEFSLRYIEHQTVTSWMNEFGKRCIIILILFDWSHYTIFGLLKYKSLSAIFFGTVEDGEQIIYVIRPTILSVISENIYPLLHLTDTTDQIFQNLLGTFSSGSSNKQTLQPQMRSSKRRRLFRVYNLIYNLREPWHTRHAMLPSNYKYDETRDMFP